MAASNTDLDELLDGALDDFRDEPSGAAQPESTASSPPPADSSGASGGGGTSGSAAAVSPGAAGLKFDPLGKAPAKGGSPGKGPMLPPRPPQRGKDTAAAGGTQQQAGGQKQARAAGIAGDSTGGMLPDLAATLQALAAQSSPDAAQSGSGAPNLEATLRAAAAATLASASNGAGTPENDELVKELTEHLQGLGGDASDPEDMDSFVGSIMKQLLSKSVLYQSMQDIGARYPQWLASHADSLSGEDLDRYSRQHQHILDICRLYEQDPDDFSAIYEKLQQMQACGTPPDEIVQELSPGLQFDAEGLPQLPEGAAPPGCCIQ